MYKEISDFVRSLYPQEDFVPLHAPVFGGNEKKYVSDCIDTTFVSSVGEYVTKFEEMVCAFTRAKYAVATVNGTSALHMGLILVGVERDTEVLTQALTFVATANAISYVGAVPSFIDSGKDNLGLCPDSLAEYLNEVAEVRDTGSFNKKTGKRISACVPMHVFGHPVDMDKIKKICDQYCIPLVEDAAESLGSFYKGTHTGLTGDLGILSFNGNKIVTCGGGGMIITNNEALAKRGKHLTTTAKIPHRWDFYHDEIGYNYRLPNLNAALACAQMEELPEFLENKRKTADLYKDFFNKFGIKFLNEPTFGKSNFWLNAIKFKNITERDEFLKYSNDCKIMTRPLWKLMTDLPAFSNCSRTSLKNAQLYVDTIVNIPSSVRSER
jgi:aminotransferase in exopolysaccharide biosynthesis